MGLAPEKASRINGRDTQTTCPDPWSDGSAKLELAIYYGEPNRISRLKISGGVTSDLGSVINDCGDKHYNIGRDHRAVMGLYNGT